jgi:hypothetical protein
MKAEANQTLTNAHIRDYQADRRNYRADADWSKNGGLTRLEL